jgi:hypothetical protein
MVRMVNTSFRHNGRAEFGPMTLLHEPTGEERKRDRERERIRKKRYKKRGRRGKMVVFPKVDHA